MWRRWAACRRRMSRAPPSISPQMIAMIEQLIAAGHAYEAEGHVLFDVSSKPDYGKLARRSLDEMIAGARVEVAPYKKKPDGFRAVEAVRRRSSRAGIRPGAAAGPAGTSNARRWRGISGRDLRHSWRRHRSGLSASRERNRAERKRASRPSAGAIWMHNGFLQVEGEKMSKSLGNFVTIRELLEDWPGEVLRFNMLRTHYRQPMDWTVQGMKESWKMLERWYARDRAACARPRVGDADFFAALCGRSQHAAGDRRACTRLTRWSWPAGWALLGFSAVAGAHRRQDRKCDAAAIADAIAARNARAQGEELRRSRPHPRRACWQRASCLKDGARRHDAGR